MYNQGILRKCFDWLDKGRKGFLTWNEFLNGMEIVISRSEEHKVDQFLTMVDSGAGDDDDDGGEEEEGNGCFDLGEITEICKLTFKDFKGAEEESSDESGSDDDDDDEDSQKEGDILTETAKL